MSEVTGSALADAVSAIPVEWLRERRWFSSKGRTVASITLRDWGQLPIDRPAIVAIALVQYTTGRDEQYVLPLVASREAQPDSVPTPPATTINHDSTTWYVHDAFQFGSFQRLLMERLIDGSNLPLDKGRIVFEPEAPLRASPPPLEAIKLVTAEQSNSSIIYDRQVILKVFRRVVAGMNPDVEVSRFLSTRAGFEHTPTMLGSIAYVAADGTEHSLGVLQAFVPNDGDAWEYTLDELDRFLNEAQHAQASSDDERAAEVRRLADILLQDIYVLGTLTGEMHVALASDPHDPDFAPRPLTAEQIEEWQHAIREQSRSVLGDLEQRVPSLPQDQQEAIAALLDARPKIEQRIGQLGALAQSNVVMTRFHGDYHLGQILVSERGFLILDFEGEPLRSLEERRAHHSPLKDVAGMLRSLSYAAHASLRRASNRHAEAEHWIDTWEREARASFLSGYLDATHGAPFLPQEDALIHATIAVFEIEKAIYELNYELNNRPDWLSIPLQGIQRTIESRPSA